eukprot:TRINITY_DN1420_c0_g1_i3.p1 TRINITY_DN1420_c0_g1~~TRINITY_DN1420_c0_g1_i3.p1  ORF type:complete len:251 (+),score=-12.33 TRINITY_DN1420_c0_g1_i3:381-1133(+)
MFFGKFIQTQQQLKLQLVKAQNYYIIQYKFLNISNHFFGQCDIHVRIIIIIIIMWTFNKQSLIDQWFLFLQYIWYILKWLAIFQVRITRGYQEVFNQSFIDRRYFSLRYMAYVGVATIQQLSWQFNYNQLYIDRFNRYLVIYNQFKQQKWLIFKILRQCFNYIIKYNSNYGRYFVRYFSQDILLKSYHIWRFLCFQQCKQEWQIFCQIFFLRYFIEIVSYLAISMFFNNVSKNRSKKCLILEVVVIQIQN